MYKRILVPLDGSDLALTALDNAMELCRALGATLVLIHVFDQRTGSAEAGRRYLDFVREEHANSGVATELAVRKAPVAQAIINAACKLSIDLIVMATHGRSGVQRVVYGSVAEQILRGSSVPTLLVRAPGAAVEQPDDCAARTLQRRILHAQG